MRGLALCVVHGEELGEEPADADAPEPAAGGEAVAAARLGPQAPYVSLYLPTSPYISLYLRISP